MAPTQEHGVNRGLDRLLNTNRDALRYFQGLPDYVQDMIIQRRQSVQTADDLRDYADNITQGDK